MPDRFFRFALVCLLILLAAFVAQPYVTSYFYAATSPRPITPRADLTELEKTTIALFNRSAPSVVQVIGQADSSVKSGSGFIWDPAGDVVTNNHVVEGVGNIVIRLAGGDDTSAQVIGRTPNYDLAVLRLGHTAHLPPPLPIGRSSDLQVGQMVLAIGNPFGLDLTLTTGVISALKRRLPESGGREITNVIQTDAPINPGNSGGPLLDSAGRVIGVNTAIYSPSGANAGIGFAIPIDIANRVVPELISKGRVPTPGIGIMAADPAIAPELGVHGVIVAQTIPGSPAEKAGLKGIDAERGTLGDIIVGADGKSINSLSDLTAEVARIGIGNTIHLKVQRGDQTRDVDLTVTDIG